MNCCGYIIIDERSGDNICSNCGRASSSIGFGLDIQVQEEESFEYLRDICANNHITSDIEHDAMHLLREKQIFNHSYIAYALYITLQRHHVPRTIFEISKMCFIPHQDILKYDQGNKDEGIEVSPSMMTERTCYNLGIFNKRVIRLTKRVADKLAGSILLCNPPHTILAVTIFAQRPDLGAGTIACHCNVSISTVKRLFRTYKNEIFQLLESHS